jgi:hypothetical protein
MLHTNGRVKVGLAIAGVAAIMIVAMLVLMMACQKTLEGSKTANQKPVVYFVNIPPDGQTFSRNPVVYWVGTDRDGLIAYFRYHVVRVEDMGSATPEDYIATVPRDSWIY